MNRLPVVAIVGRPNVGKSSLLNAIVGKRISIVQDMPGVTRDRIAFPLQVGDRYVELVDTGGYGFVDPDQLTDHIKQQIEIAMAQAALVLFVVDGAEGLTAADEEIASLLRRQGIKTVILANKADSPKIDPGLGDFARLGLGTPMGVSAMNDRNISDIVGVIARNVDLSDAPTDIPPPTMLVAIVGKRNSGKSTLVNSVAALFDDGGGKGGAAGRGDRVIVSEVPGTTRDSIDVRFEKEGKALVVIDTAGVRKKRHMVTNDVEFYSFHRAQRSVRRADVVMLLVDATQPVSEPDKKLAQYIADQHKPVILVVNKWDLALEMRQAQLKDGSKEVDDQDFMAQYRAYLDEELKHLDYAPIAFITAKDGKRVQGVLDLAQHLFKQANTRVTTHKLNDAVRAILDEQQPSNRFGRRAKVYYVTQTDVAPPTIVLFVNNPDHLNVNYQRFMINRMRDLLPYPEVPIRLLIRQRERTPLGATPPSPDDIIEGGKKRPVARAKAPAAARKPSGPVRKPARAGGRRGAGGKRGKPRGR